MILFTMRKKSTDSAQKKSGKRQTSPNFFMSKSIGKLFVFLRERRRNPLNQPDELAESITVSSEQARRFSGRYVADRARTIRSLAR